MIDGEPLVRWRYIQAGDMLEYEHNGTVKQVGPVLKVELKPNADNFHAPQKKRVLVSSLIKPGLVISATLTHVQAVFRDGIEVIRFLPDEKQHYGCATCGQRRMDSTIRGSVFCSLHCQMEWIARYYMSYPKGENPIDKDETIHTCNCDECRMLNRVYCPRCVD